MGQALQAKIPFCHHHHALHRVGQFTHVPRPVPGHQTKHGSVIDPWDGAANFRSPLPHEVTNQQRNVFTTLPQGWDMDLSAPNSVIKVLAEIAVLDVLLQVSIGRADESNVGFTGVIGPQTDNLTRFQNAEQTGLHAHRHVADLIEEQRPLVRVFKNTFTITLGPGVRTAHMPEQFIFEQTFRLTRGIESDIPLGGTWRHHVNGRGHQFFACPRFTRNQNRKV